MSVLYLDKRNIVIGVVCLAVMFSLGVIIGYYGRDPPSKFPIIVALKSIQVIYQHWRSNLQEILSCKYLQSKIKLKTGFIV